MFNANKDAIGSFLGAPIGPEKKSVSSRETGGYQGRNPRSNDSRSSGPRKPFQSREGSSGGSRGSFRSRDDNRAGRSEGDSRSFGGGNSRPRRQGGGLRNVSKIHESKFINRIDIQKNADTKYVNNLRVSDLLIHDLIKQNLAGKGISDLTEIQDKTIPSILVGQDVVGVADTGTGKTFAFLVPLVDKIQKNNANKVIIITPTRELAMQINEELKFLVRGLSQFSVLCIGGVKSSFQEYNLRKRFNFVIGTPGRIKDLSDRGQLKLGQFNHLVLDEVDRMMEMGFIEDIKEIVGKLPDDRQTLFFTATMNSDIEKLMSKFLSIDHLKVYVKKQDTSANVDQDIIRVTAGEDKIDKLLDLIKSEDIKRAIIFTNTKRNVDHLSRILYDNGVPNVAIHGDKMQSRRTKNMDLFRSGQAGILIATDVAARGLDIPKVEHVINYDAPIVYNDYVHRIGRTGRANSVGKAFTFVEDKKIVAGNRSEFRKDRDLYPRSGGYNRSSSGPRTSNSNRDSRSGSNYGGARSDSSFSRPRSEGQQDNERSSASRPSRPPFKKSYKPRGSY